jgi:uncharacterized membrane protein YdjX (TVP38/TMEM64 family)
MTAGGEVRKEGLLLRKLKWLFLAAAMAGLFLALRALDLGARLQELVETVRGLGPAGVLVYALIYVAATVAMLPASPLTLAAGFVWGPLLGTAIVSPASVAGATAAFLVGRKLARARVERALRGNRLFAAVDAAIGGNGFKVVALLRLSPLFPFNLLNYALSLSRVRTRDYVLGSLVGMIPGTFLYVYLGSLVSSVAEIAGGRTPTDWRKQALFAAGLVATAVVTALVTRLARAELRRHVPGAAAAPAPPTEVPT